MCKVYFKPSLHHEFTDSLSGTRVRLVSLIYLGSQQSSAARLPLAFQCMYM